MTTTQTTCQVDTCAFHHPSEKCAAGEIQVMLKGSKAFCETFVPRDKDKQPVSGSNAQIGTNLRQGAMAEDNLNVNLASSSHIWEGHASNLSPLVACNASNCQYNQHRVCFAGELIIDGQSASTSSQAICDMYSPE